MTTVWSVADPGGPQIVVANQSFFNPFSWTGIFHINGGRDGAFSRINCASQSLFKLLLLDRNFSNRRGTDGGCSRKLFTIYPSSPAQKFFKSMGVEMENYQ